MGFLWNHWFWITLGLVARGCSESRPFQVETKRTVDFPSDGPLISLPVEARGGQVPPGGRLMARGGRILVIPVQVSIQDNGTNAEVRGQRPSVSVSKSVSKVSVKIGDISEEPRGQNPWKLSSEAPIPWKISESRGQSLKNSRSQPELSHDAYPEPPRRLLSPLTAFWSEPSEAAKTTGPVKRQGLRAEKRGRKIDPQYTGYNLVYRDTPVKPTARPSGLLSTIIAKLKSLAEATTSRIRFSSLLLADSAQKEKEPSREIIKDDSDEKDVIVQPKLTQFSKDPKVLEISEKLEEDKNSREAKVSNSWQNTAESETPSQSNVFLRIDDLGVSADTDYPIKETDETNPEIDNTIDMHPGKDEPGRSSEARGRSLPLHIMESPEIRAEPEENKEMLAKIQEVSDDYFVPWKLEEREKKEEEISEVEDELENLEKIVEDSDVLINQDDYVQEEAAKKITGTEGVQIEVEKVNQANISAIIGVVVGIVIFIILSIVLILVGVQQGEKKKEGPAEDQISQSSYMTYSTTVSDQSVNYGPNWDNKDMLEDLCSLDNDSFLNSLEAVTTTDYWAD